jgi:hypothetical protein
MALTFTPVDTWHAGKRSDDRGSTNALGRVPSRPRQVGSRIEAPRPVRLVATTQIWSTASASWTRLEAAASLVGLRVRSTKRDPRRRLNAANEYYVVIRAMRHQCRW